MPKQHIRDIDLYYEIAGEGQPLLFIHGLGSCTEDWQQQVAFFSRDYQVIAFDLRGHGRSDKPAGPYSIEQLAKDTIELMEFLGLGPTHVVGLSLGGMVAFQMAVNTPELLKSMVIVNSGPMVPNDTLKQRLPLYLRLVIIRLLGLGRMGKMLSKKLFPKPEQNALRQQFVERLSGNDKRTYLAALRAIFGWSVAEHLGAIDCPTLVIAADQDYTPVALKEAYVAKMPKAQLITIPDSRHAVPLERPEQFNGVLSGFLLQQGAE